MTDRLKTDPAAFARKILESDIPLRPLHQALLKAWARGDRVCAEGIRGKWGIIRSACLLIGPGVPDKPEGRQLKKHPVTLRTIDERGPK